MSVETPLLDVRGLRQAFVVPGRAKGFRGKLRFEAVAGVSLSVGANETVGVVGETGCGKSTLARAIVQSPRPRSGEVLLDGVDLSRLRGEQLRVKRREIQLVFQDAYSSLDPRWKVIDQVAEPMRIHGIGTPQERTERAAALLNQVGLDPARIGSRRPHEVSGGECQRIVIARALMLSPKLLILDEPVASLDVSVQAQVLNLLEDLRDQLGLSYVFISHDLSVVRHVSDRVAVMYLGRLCEVAPAKSLYAAPFHHYSAELIASIPDPGTGKHASDATGTRDVPSPVDAPSGCRFRTRCPAAQPTCAEVEPELRELAPGHLVACHFPLRSNGSAESSAPVAPTAAGTGAKAGGVVSRFRRRRSS